MLRQCAVIAALGFPVALWADSHTAASCSHADVNAAVAASSAGDTVFVPAGAAIWSSCVEIAKPISVIGAGPDKTILTASGNMFVLQQKYGFFWVHGFSSNLPVRTSGFFFEMTDWTPQYAIVVGTWDVALDKMRIDHNVFNHGQFPIEIGGSKGSIDHNYFYNNNIAISFTAGNTAQANASWESMAAGTNEALFIEDNHFIDDAKYTGGYADEKIGTYNGGKLVIRYNHFDGREFKHSPNITFTPIMTHGSAAGGSYPAYWQSGSGARRGQSVVEIYENLEEGTRIDDLAIVRGSANLIYNNIVGPVQYTPRISLREEESENPDQWIPARTNWPAEDQVHNTFIWNNKGNGAMLGDANIANSPSEFIQKNRDYFLHPPEAVGGKEYFTGAHGASGSYPTDGTKYPTLGTMVFTPSGPNAYYPYIPYVYPHPLTLGDYSGARALGLSVDNSQLRWNAVTGADHYVVYSDWQNPATVTATQCPCPSGNVYFVQALDAGGTILSAEGALSSSAIIKNPVKRALNGAVETLEITIYNAAGKVVYHAVVPARPIGRHTTDPFYEYTWNHQKTCGVYFAVMHGKTADGKVVKSKTRFAVVR
jgi:hypothetical protein